MDNLNMLEKLALESLIEVSKEQNIIGVSFTAIACDLFQIKTECLKPNFNDLLKSLESKGYIEIHNAEIVYLL